MKKIMIVFILLLNTSFADTIKLKDGSQIVGNVVAKTDKLVVVKTDSETFKFKKEDIESIIDVKNEEPSEKKDERKKKYKVISLLNKYLVLLKEKNEHKIGKIIDPKYVKQVNDVKKELLLKENREYLVEVLLAKMKCCVKQGTQNNSEHIGARGYVTIFDFPEWNKVLKNYKKELTIRLFQLKKMLNDDSVTKSDKEKYGIEFVKIKGVIDAITVKFKK